MDRSDRIRTYNFPQVSWNARSLLSRASVNLVWSNFCPNLQDRVTDHRIGVSLNGIAKFMEGDDEDGTGLAHLISALRERNDQQRLEAMLTAVQAESQPAEAGNGKKRGAK